MHQWFGDNTHLVCMNGYTQWYIAKCDKSKCINGRGNNTLWIKDIIVHLINILVIYKLDSCIFVMRTFSRAHTHIFACII